MLAMRYIKHLALAIMIFFNLAASPANSTIVYSGILDLNGPNFSIDINNDGSSDFVTSWRTWAAGNGFSQNGYDAEMNFNMRVINTELAGFSGFPGAKAPLDYGELIGPNPPNGLLWSSNSNDSMLWTTVDMWNDPFVTHSGIWNNLNNKYLGFEMGIAPDSFYGWIQLDTDAFNNVTLIDYAYEGISSTPITAGATSAPVPEPSTMLLLGSGLIGLAGYGRKKFFKK